MRERRLYATCLCAFAVPAVVLLPRAGWVTAAVGCVVAMSLVILLRRLRGGADAISLAARTRAGRTALRLLWCWNLLMLGAGARLLCGVYPNGSAVIGLLLLLLAAYAAGRGTETALRAGAIGLFFAAAILGTVILFALPQTNAQWLAPQPFSGGAELPWLAAPLLGVWLLRGAEKKPLGWCLGGAVTAVAAALVTAGTLSPQVARQTAFPFYAAAKGVGVLGAMERFEPLVSAALTVCGFCLLGLLCAVNDGIRKTLAPARKIGGAPLNFVLGGTCLWLSALVPTAVLAAGNTTFWVLLPIVLLSVENRKKFKNFRKNA